MSSCSGASNSRQLVYRKHHYHRASHQRRRYIHRLGLASFEYANSRLPPTLVDNTRTRCQFLPCGSAEASAVAAERADYIGDAVDVLTVTAQKLKAFDRLHQHGSFFEECVARSSPGLQSSAGPGQLRCNAQVTITATPVFQGPRNSLLDEPFQLPVRVAAGVLPVKSARTSRL